MVSFDVGGERVLIDEEDLWIVAGLKWHLQRSANKRTTYVLAYTADGESLYLHRLVLNAQAGIQVDHRNLSGLDNRKANLRACTNQENQWNSARQRNNTSGFKGVTWDKVGQHWYAGYRHHGRRVHIGSFDTAEAAHAAWIAAVAPLRGDFCRTN